MSGLGRLRVGLQRNHYPERRNISGSLVGADYVIPEPEGRWVRRLRREWAGFRGGSRNPVDHEFTFEPGTQIDVDIFHVFNSVVLGDRPWVTTFETVVPRFASTLSCHHGPDPDFSALRRDARVRGAIERLADDSCKALLALSRCNLRMQEELLREFPEQDAAIRTKLAHLPPPQTVLIEDVDEKDWNAEREIRFVFVGSAFFRKGGREILDVLSRLRRTDPRIHLTVVSDLRPDDYVGVIRPDEVKETASRIESLSGWVDHFPVLGHEEVLALMRRSHAGLLPTYADTYGYSVLEFQAAGCPVITTDVRALSEINDHECGWIIEVPRNRLGEALYTTDRGRQTLRGTIEQGLESAVRDLLANPTCLRIKAGRCLERVRREHGPSAHGATLGAIYARATGRG